MKQVFFKNGVAKLQDVPVPRPGKNELLIQVNYSCISPGTERTLMSESKRDPLLQLVAEKPERVKKAYNTLRFEGIKTTLAKIKGDLNLGTPSGYSLSGIVVETGINVEGFKLGDRVACAGAEHAYHAEFVTVPSLLTVPVPNNVDMKQASTVTLGAISLQGIRRADVRLGECIAVIGLGALGLISGLLLIKSGCQVIGFDVNPNRMELAKSLGFHVVLNASDNFHLSKINHFTKGFGVDAVIVTAASSDKTIVALAADICRKKGRVIVVGDVSLTLVRQDWYPKELDLLISTSYGPGRYDPKYELDGFDYPFAYVRWTENRNMSVYLQSIQAGLDISPLINGIYPFFEAEEAFKNVIENSIPAPLILMEYEPSDKGETYIEVSSPPKLRKDCINVAIIGVGEFARDVHLPNLLKLKDRYQIYAIMDKQNFRAKEVALRYNAHYATTDYAKILQDDQVDLVFITTRHDLHAPLAIYAAQSGKAIFVEKPMAISNSQLIELERVLKETKVPFMVGFNRRFSPFITCLNKFLKDRIGPIMIYYRVNSTLLSPHHWIYSAEGGGRVIGEGCHFIDLLNFLISSDLESFTTSAVKSNLDKIPIDSSFQVTFKYKDGSLANLFYTSLGSKDFPKEYIEAFFDGEVITLHNFQELKLNGKKIKSNGQKDGQKGHFEELEQFAQFMKGKEPAPISLKDMINTTRITFEIKEKLKSGCLPVNSCAKIETNM